MSSTETTGRIAPGPVRCSELGPDLVLYLYDELTAPRRTAVEEHARRCERCRGEIESLRSTLEAIDRARLPEMARGSEAPGEWAALRRRLAAAGPPAGRPLRIAAAPLLKAAAILIVTAASFLAGRQWDVLIGPHDLSGAAGGGAGAAAGPPGERSAGGPPASLDSAARLQLFSERTHGYLNRSRLVLLEFANADEAPDSSALRAASLNLLRETKAARRVAGQIGDPRIEILLGEVESILSEIARLSDPDDATTVRRIRTHVNDSGVLAQLELLSAAPPRLAEEPSS